MSLVGQSGSSVGASASVLKSSVTVKFVVVTFPAKSATRNVMMFSFAARAMS
jgi:hypothetical protein